MAWDSLRTGVSHVIATYMKYQNLYSRIKTGDATNKPGGAEKTFRGTPSVIVEISAGDNAIQKPLTYSALRA